MASFGNMRDAYNSIYESNCNSKKKTKKVAVKEALDTLIESGIIDEDEFQTLMERGKPSPALQKEIDDMNQKLKVSNDKNGKTKKSNKPNATPKPIGDEARVPGMFNHGNRKD